MAVNIQMSKAANTRYPSIDILLTAGVNGSRQTSKRSFFIGTIKRSGDRSAFNELGSKLIHSTIFCRQRQRPQNINFIIEETAGNGNTHETNQ